MTENKNLIGNRSFNFKLKGVSSVLIGIYILISSVLIKLTLTAFVTDDSPVGFLSIENLGALIGFITFLAYVFSLLALFFGSRKAARKINYKVWSNPSKKSLRQIVILFIFGYIIMYSLLNNGYYNFIVPTFLICYGLLLSLLNYSKYTSLYVFTLVSILIGIFALFFPEYWLQSLMFLGLTHIAFGILVKN